MRERAVFFVVLCIQFLYIETRCKLEANVFLSKHKANVILSHNTAGSITRDISRAEHLTTPQLHGVHRT